MKTYRLSWYLTWLSANDASRNSAQYDSADEADDGKGGGDFAVD